MSDIIPQKIKCKACGEEKEPSLMRVMYGKPRSICRKCDGKGRGARYKKTPRKRTKSGKDRINSLIREARSQNLNPEKFILIDSRKGDRRRGRENDLTADFIRERISGGCAYCLETEGRMTLDRIDNDIGHLQSNVIPSCVRCNYIRKDMPYQAWMLIVPAVREARLKGLFEGWSGGWQWRKTGGSISRPEGPHRAATGLAPTGDSSSRV